MIFAMLPLDGFEVKAAEVIWQNQSLVHWSNGRPTHGTGEEEAYHTAIYSDTGISYFPLDEETYGKKIADTYHGAHAICSQCHATANVTTVDDGDGVYFHNYNPQTGACDDCGYSAQLYVTLEFSLAEGVEKPAGFVEEEKKGPYKYGDTYTVVPYNYEGLKASRIFGYSTDKIYEDIVVKYEYSYTDPCTKGGNHDWSYVSVDESTHDYCCSKCSESLGTGHHDHEGKSNRSLDCCQFACSQCGFKKTFVAHNFEKYPLTNKDGSTSYIKVCLNCGFETTDCEHEWETEQFVEEGGDHVRVCKLCGFEDRHAIDCEGSWSFVHKKDICRLPCCRKCKQTTFYNIDETACIHEFVIENTGKPDTHRVRCKNCTDVIEEDDPCFSEQAWIVASTGLSSEEYEEMCSKIVTDNGDNTYTVHCPCGTPLPITQ